MKPDDKQQFNKTFNTQVQDKLNKRAEILEPGKKISQFQQEVAAEKDRVKQYQEKDKTDPTVIKKRSWGPLQGIVDLLTPGKKKQIPDDSPEKKEQERQVQNRIEGLTIQDIVAPPDLEVDFKHIQMGDWYFQTLFVTGYPRFVGPNWLSPMINFEHSLSISTYYYPVDNKVIMQKLKRKIGEIEATLYSQMEGRKAVDPSLKIALTDAQQLQDAIAEGTEKYFHFGMYITVQARTPDDLEKISKNLISTLASINVTARPAMLQQEQGFVSTQPLGLDKIFITRNMDTTSLATTFPFVTSELTMDHGIMYGLNQHNRSLVIFDRFDMQNANSVIFATSGAGKSYFVKLEAIRSLMFGTEILIIDPEKEFEKLCGAVNGAYISFSQDKGAKMNPFELSGVAEDQDELRIKMLSLQGFFRIMMGGLNAIETAILDRALILTYREKGITLDPATQKNANYPLLEDLYKVLKGMAEPEARGLAGRLERYIIGSAAGIFNEKSTVELNNPFTVFTLRDMPEELRPMVMYLMLDYIWTTVRRERKRRLLLVDEAWIMMQNEDSAKFLYGIVKRARKYYLGVSTITQDVEDFMKSDMGKAIVTNSAIQFLMKQSPSAVDGLQKIFNLSEGEKQFLLTADTGQGLFFAGSNHVAIQVVSSQAEHELITTNPKDLELLKASEGVADTRTIEELGQIYEPPAMQQPIKEAVDKKRLGIGKAVENRRQKIEQMIEEKLKVAAERIDQQQGASGVSSVQNVSEMVQNPPPGYGTLTDHVVAERKALNQGRTHLTPYGIVGEDTPSQNSEQPTGQDQNKQ